MPPTIKVTGLSIYPVKSLAGINLKQSELDIMGLKYDRRWMVVSPEGKFMTQRTFPQMALIHTEINNGALTLRKEGMDNHSVPTTSHDSAMMEATVWKDTLKVHKVSNETDVWLTQAIGEACHLVYISDDVMRQCDLEFANEGEQTGFADGFPILIISEASLDDLNQKLNNKVDMRRFRPNIIIDGCEAFAEDQFTSFRIADIPMRGVKLCSRCPLPTVDPDTGIKTSQEPIATLMKYRKWDNKVFFGINVIHESEGTLKVGDKLVLAS